MATDGVADEEHAELLSSFFEDFGGNCEKHFGKSGSQREGEATSNSIHLGPGENSNVQI